MNYACHPDRRRLPRGSLLMPQPPLSRRAVHRTVVATSTALLVALSVCLSTIGAAAASAATYRTWTLSGVTFADGGEMSGSFRVTDSGEVSEVRLTTTGGDEGTYGASTTYDASNSTANLYDNYLYVNFEDRSRYLRLRAGDLTVAEDGEIRAIVMSSDESYECLNCAPYRVVSAGTLVAGHLVGAPIPAVEVRVPSGLHLGGREVRVAATGLEPDQPYTVAIGHVMVGSGTAPHSGSISRTVTVPRTIGDRLAEVRVASAHRTGSADLRVVQAKRLGLQLGHRVLHKRQRQLVRITGLAAGEQVSVKYRNRVVSPSSARASQAGSYRIAVRVGRLAGTKTFTAVGGFSSRLAVSTCRVTRHR